MFENITQIVTTYLLGAVIIVMIVAIIITYVYDSCECY